MNLLSSAKAALARRGWLLRKGASREEALFRVLRADGSLVGSIGAPPGGGGPLAPAVKLAPEEAGALGEEDRRGFQELAAILGLYLESKRPSLARRALVKAERHEEADADRALLRITTACNQRCPFCFIPPERGRLERGSLRAELRALSRALPPGSSLTVSGGEPTVEPGLLELLGEARSLGIHRFVLQTNAVRLWRPGLIDRLADLGVRAYLVSFHSHKPGPYGRITGSRGQFRRAVHGLAGLLRNGRAGVTCNVVVNAVNCAELPSLIGFLAKLCAGLPEERRPGVFFSMINGAGLYKAPSMGVSLEKAAPALRLAVARCRQEGLRVERFGGESAFPVCVLDDPAAFAPERTFSQDRVRYSEDFSGEAGGVGRVKRPACRACPWDARCLGVPAEYARMFGLRGLGPRG